MDLQPERHVPVWLFALLVVLVLAVAGSAWWWLTRLPSAQDQAAILPATTKSSPAAQASASPSVNLNQAATDLDNSVKSLDSSLTTLQSIDTSQDATPAL